MSSNQLRLNAEKTQFILLGSSLMLAKTNKNRYVSEESCRLPLDDVRDLGVVLDSNLTMKKHVMASSVVASITFNNYGPSADH